MDMLPLAKQFGERLAILLNTYEFNAARKCLEEGIKRVSWMHNPKKIGEVPIADLIMPDMGGEWEYDLIEKLESLDVRYVSQVLGKSWEQLKNLGLEDKEISWVQYHSDFLQTRIFGTRKGQFDD